MAKCDHRRRLAAGHEIAELRRIRRFEPSNLPSADLTSARHVHCDATGFTLGRRHAHERHGNRSVPWCPGLGRHDERNFSGGRFEQLHSQQTVARIPISDCSAVHLIDDEAGGDHDRDLARQSLKDLDTHGGGHLTRVFTEPDHVCHACAHAQRLLRTTVVDFPFPRHRHRLARTAVRGPPRFGGGFGAVGDEAAGQREVHAALRQREPDARNRRRRRRQRDRFRAGRRRERNDDVECQERASRARQEHVRRRPVDQRHRLTVEGGFANHQTGRDLQPRPALAEDVDCQNRTASDRFRVDAQVVVEARQRRVNRRRRGWRGRIRALAQRPIFIDGKNNPAIGRRRCLRGCDPAHNEAHTHDRSRRDALDPFVPSSRFDTGKQQAALSGRTLQDW